MLKTSVSPSGLRFFRTAPAISRRFKPSRQLFRCRLRATGAGVETGKPVIEIRYRSDRFITQVIGLKIYLQENLFKQTEQVLVEAYDGKGARANLVGEAADCDARDERTRLVTLQAGQEIFVPC